MNRIQNKKTQFIDLGLIDFQDAWTYQTSLFEKTLQIKAQNRNLSEDQQKITDNYLLFCEHHHVYTQGKSGKDSNLLVSKEGLSSIRSSYYQINRGGDITYHGPGQVVGYPIFDLENFFTDIHKYMRALEEVIIQTLAELGIPAGRISGLTGVWVNAADPATAKKICAFGVRASRWVTMHGFALNVNTDLDYFKNIVPCGIADKAVTSVQKESGKVFQLKEVEEILKNKFSQVFALEFSPLVQGVV